MKNIEIVEIKISALPGSLIEACIKEGIELAAREWRNVRLRHNGKDYLIRPNDLVASVTIK